MNVIGHQNLYTKMVLIDQKLNALDKKVSGLDDKLDILIKLVSENKDDCKKMSSHIDFIDSVYNNVKAPMNYICSNINQRFIENKFD